MIHFLADFMSENLANALAWTIFHSLWQGALIALIMSIVLKQMHEASSRKKYNVALFSIYAVLFSSVCTFLILYNGEGTEFMLGERLFLMEQTGASLFAEAGNNSLVHWLSGLLNEHFYMIVNIWILGALFFTARLIHAYLNVRRYAQLEGKPSPSLEAIFNEMLPSFKIIKQVKLIESDKVLTPMVLGFLKPVILVPLGILNQLETKDVESILAHELAHIARNDYLHNVIN